MASSDAQMEENVSQLLINAMVTMTALTIQMKETVLVEQLGGPRLFERLKDLKD